MSSVAERATDRRAGHLPAILGLLAATVVWGSTFLVTKDTLDTMSVSNFLSWRFGLAAVILLLAAPRRWLRPSPGQWRRGVALGVFLGLGFLAQTQGLRETSAAVSGFLTGLMVVLTPLVSATAFREQVTTRGWVAVAVATIGLALISLQGWSLSPGAGLTLLGAAFFALQIASLSQWATPVNGYGLTAVSVTVAALMCAAVAVTSGEFTIPAHASEWTSLLYLAIGATCLGLVLQAWSQSHLSATTSAVIMTFEPVFAGIIAVVIGGEALTARIWLGGLVIVGAMFLAEFGPRRCCDAQVPRVEPL
ncbi:MAG: DMT family transporter [Candidatus Nanopelagicales bacterium]